MAMTTQWLTEIGLFSLSKAWKELASTRRTAPEHSHALNQRGRIRMLGGVGGVPAQPSSYPDGIVTLYVSLQVWT
jgi:hypothetical protein